MLSDQFRTEEAPEHLEFELTSEGEIERLNGGVKGKPGPLDEGLGSTFTALGEFFANEALQELLVRPGFLFSNGNELGQDARNSAQAKALEHGVKVHRIRDV